MEKYVIKYVHSISRISEGLRAYQYICNKFFNVLPGLGTKSETS